MCIFSEIYFINTVFIVFVNFSANNKFNVCLNVNDLTIYNTNTMTIL